MSGRHCISFFYRIGLLVFISSTLVTQAAVLEVREGERIQDAVNAASPGDEILVYPGLYSETVYVDKDDITLRGVVEGDEWPHLDGKKQLNDAILYSGNGFSVE